jgi:catalase
MKDPKQLTTESGAPVADNQNSLTFGPRQNASRPSERISYDRKSHYASRQ